MGSRLWKFYDIKYEKNIKWLLKQPPAEICVDLEKYSWYSTVPRGLGFLNAAARRSILEETGCTPISCKVQMIDACTKLPLSYS